MAAPDSPDEVAWRERAQRHRDWWGMSPSEQRAVLTYEAGYDHGCNDAALEYASERGDVIFVDIGYADGYSDGYSDGHRDATDKLLRALPVNILNALARRRR